METVYTETTDLRKLELPAADAERRVNWNSQPIAQHVYIEQDADGLWNWMRRTVGLTFRSRESYRTSLEAALDAIGIARCHGVPVVLPRELRPAIATHYRRSGKAKYLAGAGMESCTNNFERLGYTLAKLEAARVPNEIDWMEADLQALRNGTMQPCVTLSDADLEAADEEQLGTDWRC